MLCSNRREDSDGVEFESDSWSEDSSSDNLSRSLSNNSSKSWEDAVSEDSCCDQEGSWLRDNKLGHLYLQYTEMASPYSRVPLAEKVSLFCQAAVFTNGNNIYFGFVCHYTHLLHCFWFSCFRLMS